MQGFQTINRLKPYASGYRRTFSGIIGLGLFGAILESVSIALLIPFLYSLETGSLALELDSSTWLQATLNQILAYIPEDNQSIIIIGAIIALIIAKSLVNFLDEYLSSRGYALFAFQLRKLAYEKLHRVEMSHIDRSDAGKLVNTINDQTWGVTDVDFSFLMLLLHSFSILVLTLLLFLISWQLTLLVGLVSILISFSTRLVTGQIASLSKIGVELEEKMTGQIIRSVQGIRAVRMFNREKFEKSQYENSSEEIKKVFFKMDVLESLIQPIAEIFSMVFVIAAILWLMQEPGQLPILITLVVVVYRLHPQVVAWDQARIEILAGSGSVDAFADLLEAQDQEAISADLVPYSGLKNKIEFFDLSFQYENDDGAAVEALSNVSLSLGKNQTTAIVGPSGSGKSTLINLLLRFYTPTQGAICVDDVPLESLSLTDWRSKMAVVSQNAQIFNFTIAENIGYGNPNATHADIVEAAKNADAHEFICGLPDGYDTVVGDQGERLSGGQKQRLSLARAFLRDPEILILDEATNALDSISESHIYKYLLDDSQARTIVIISHNLSRIEHADQIYVLDAGRVVESGVKSDLILEKGLFARLHESQNRFLDSGELELEFEEERL
ncbi:MAG: ABC transporter ATP-binding protein [Chloroflexota bacterium]